MAINRQLWNKYTISWYLLDFGSSFTSIVGILYFSQWLVIEHNVSEAWYTAPTIIATILLLFVSTHIGWVGDKFGKHFRNLKIITIVGVTSMALLVLSGYFFGSFAPWIALFFFFIYTFMFQLTFVPYAAFIKTLVPGELYGKLSGFGLSASQVGSVVAVIVAVFMLKMGGFSSSVRLDIIFVLTVLHILFILPSLIVLKGKNPAPFPDIPHQSIRHSLRNGYREARKYPGVLPLLVSFYLFSDAIMTAILYFGLFLEKVLHVNDTTKSYMYLAITGGFAVGALICGMLSDRYPRKKVLIGSLLPNALCIFLTSFVLDPTYAFVLYLFLGLTIGAAYTASRSYLASLIPIEKQGIIFGLYTFSERAASIVGPLLWLVILTFIPGERGYQVALCVLSLCTLGSIIPLIYKKRQVIA